jgi:hypothetical protein
MHEFPVKIELPRQFYLEPPNENNPWELITVSEPFEFNIPNADFRDFNLEEQLLIYKPVNNTYIPIPINDVEVLDWFTLKYIAKTQDEFREILTYWGYRLFKVKTERNYNNMIIEDYFLFKINDQGIQYCHYPYERRNMALRVYLKKVKKFDLTLLMCNADENQKTSLYDFLCKPGNTNRHHFDILNNGDDNQIKGIINDQNAFSLNFNYTIKEFFIFDPVHNLFAIRAGIHLPKTVEKYLVALSGCLPHYKTLVKKIPNNDIITLAEGNKEIKGNIKYVIYENIPERIAYTISNSLIIQLVAPGVGDALPYTVQNLN